MILGAEFMARSRAVKVSNVIASLYHLSQMMCYCQGCVCVCVCVCARMVWLHVKEQIDYLIVSIRGHPLSHIVSCWSEDMGVCMGS